VQRKYRLKSSGAFRYLYKKGTSVPGKHLALVYAASRNGLHIGLSVGKSVGGAVVRNRVKRLLRENLRAMISQNAIESGFNYIVIARETLAQLNFVRIREELDAVFKRAGKLKTR
jgi:ribonuclease P protein component